MPELKIKHVVSFSSEDKVHKAENLLKPETYRKWKCATQGEKQASAILQFEKASLIHSIDIGNEYSAFVEVLVSRSSDTNGDYKVLLVASSFMSPLESRNGTNVNRVRMFGPEKLAQNFKNEKWDTVQIICTQPFNKNVQYGLTFVKFHSPPEVQDENKTLTIGGFKLKPEESDKPSEVGSWFLKRKEKTPTISSTSPSAIRQASSFAAATLASTGSSIKSPSSSSVSVKRKHEEDQASILPTKKQETIAIRRSKSPVSNTSFNSQESKSTRINPTPSKTKPSGGQTTNQGAKKVKKENPFQRLMAKVVFVISGFQNPLRSDIREYALEMGATYKADWNSNCTHLVCAFVNTPKYVQVRKAGGRVVSKEWIIDCYKKRQLLPWRNYMLGSYQRAQTPESDSDRDERITQTSVTPAKPALKPKTEEKSNGKLNSVDKEPPSSSNDATLPSTSNVELMNSYPTDESKDNSSAESDYDADTDVDSNGDTEEEIEKIESSARKKEIVIAVQQSEPKPDTKSLLLPELPDFLKNRHFFFYGTFQAKEHQELERYITAYNGIIENYMDEKVKYVITSSKWSKEFDEALCDNDNLIFVNPKWIYKCHQFGKLVPYQPFIIVPEDVE